MTSIRPSGTRRGIGTRLLRLQYRGVSAMRAACSLRLAVISKPSDFIRMSASMQPKIIAGADYDPRVAACASLRDEALAALSACAASLREIEGGVHRTAGYHGWAPAVVREQLAERRAENVALLAEAGMSGADKGYQHRLLAHV